jgi:hypothetical protein
MATSYNDIFDAGQPWDFRLTVYDDKWEKQNVSTWQFRIAIKKPDNSYLYDIQNGDILRPSTSSIYYKLDAAEVDAIPAGEYTFSLFVTNDEAIDDEMIKGIIVKP